MPRPPLLAPARLFAVVAALGALVTTSACSKEQPGPAGPSAPGSSDPGEKACTMIGCENGVRLTINKPTPWVAGAYVFNFELDGKAVECKGALPLQSCEAGPSLSCTADAKVRIGESGCALPVAQHGFSDITVLDAPQRVKIKVSRDGQEIGAADLTPNYMTSQPNGEGCEPTCTNASGELAIP
jgi:hypothetical protein